MFGSTSLTSTDPQMLLWIVANAWTITFFPYMIVTMMANAMGNIKGSMKLRSNVDPGVHNAFIERLNTLSC